MKAEHQNLNPTELALLTWHGGNDLEHISIKLAGEIGELLDLYGKHKYKPGFNWFRCKCGHEHTFDHCTWEEVNIDNRTIYTCPCQTLTPLVLDEMGDIWFYLRVYAHYAEFSIPESDGGRNYQNHLFTLKAMYRNAGRLLDEDNFENYFYGICHPLLWMIKDLGYGIEDLTRLNYIKLNSEESHHGWKS